MIGEILMWIVALLAWANIFIWGTVVALAALNILIPIIRGAYDIFR